MHSRGVFVSVLSLAICLAVSGAAMATTIPEGGIEYWPGHYLEGQPVEPGFDVFGDNYQARMSVGYLVNVNFLPWWGLPPYEGDDDAFYESIATLRGIDKEMAAWCVESFCPIWYARDFQIVFQWNEAYLSNQDGDDADPYLDWHPFTDPPYSSDSGFTGSGAACTSDWSGERWVEVDGDEVLTRFWAKATWVAVSEDAYVEDKLVGPDPWCLCPHWYEDGVEIGMVSLLLPGESCWATVRQRCECGIWGTISDYESPSVRGSFRSYDD
jgi:hypothetical protein